MLVLHPLDSICCLQAIGRLLFKQPGLLPALLDGNGEAEARCAAPACLLFCNSADCQVLIPQCCALGLGTPLLAIVCYAYLSSYSITPDSCPALPPSCFHLTPQAAGPLGAAGWRPRHCRDVCARHGGAGQVRSGWHWL